MTAAKPLPLPAFAALTLEPDATLRAAVLAKTESYWVTSGGPQLDLVQRTATLSLLVYAQSLQRNQPGKPPEFPHGQAVKAMSLLARVTAQVNALRDQAVAFGRAAVFVETGRRAAEPVWPQDRDPAPTVPATEAEIEQRKLPGPDQLWGPIAAEHRLRAAPGPAQAGNGDPAEQIALGIVSGLIDDKKLIEIGQSFEKQHGKERWQAILNRALDRAEEMSREIAVPAARLKTPKP